MPGSMFFTPEAEGVLFQLDRDTGYLALHGMQGSIFREYLTEAMEFALTGEENIRRWFDEGAAYVGELHWPLTADDFTEEIDAH